MAKIFLHDSSGHAFPIQLSKELARRGHSVFHNYMTDMQSPRGNLSAPMDALPNLRIEGITLGRPFPKYRYLKRIQYELAFGRKLARVLKAEAPDVFIASNMSPDRISAAVKACKKLKVGYIFWLQDAYGNAIRQLLSHRYWGLGWLAGLYYSRKETRLLGQADHAILITEDFAPFAKRAGLATDKFSVLHNWAPLDELPVLPRDNKWSTAHQLTDQFVFLYSGTLGLKHNPEHLALLAKQFLTSEKVKIVVVSEGLGADWLVKKKVEWGLHNLILLPYQDFSDMPEVLATADVLITLLEASAGVFSVPSKTLSYMCAARPILMAGPPENLGSRLLVEHGAGLTCSAEDSAAFCKHARKLHNDAPLCKALGQSARQYAEKNFDIGKIADRFESIIETVLGASSFARHRKGSAAQLP